MKILPDKFQYIILRCKILSSKIWKSFGHFQSYWLIQSQWRVSEGVGTVYVWGSFRKVLKIFLTCQCLLACLLVCLFCFFCGWTQFQIIQIKTCRIYQGLTLAGLRSLESFIIVVSYLILFDCLFILFKYKTIS